MGGHSGIKSGFAQNSREAQGLSGLYGSNAAQIGGALTPTLESELVNPQGFTPQQMSAQTTAAEQTAGGSNAGATGGALLRAARTRNAGAAPAAIGAANRGASQNLSQINAGIQENSANLAAKRQGEAARGLEGLYGENVGAGENALGLSNTSLKDFGDLGNFWQQLLMQGLKSGGEIAAAKAGA